MPWRATGRSWVLRTGQNLVTDPKRQSITSQSKSESRHLNLKPPFRNRQTVGLYERLTPRVVGLFAFQGLCWQGVATRGCTSRSWSAIRATHTYALSRRHLGPFPPQTLATLTVSRRPGYGGVATAQSVATPAHSASPQFREQRPLPKHSQRQRSAWCSSTGTPQSASTTRSTLFRGEKRRACSPHCGGIPYCPQISAHRSRFRVL